MMKTWAQLWQFPQRPGHPRVNCTHAVLPFAYPFVVLWSNILLSLRKMSSRKLPETHLTHHGRSKALSGSLYSLWFSTLTVASDLPGAVCSEHAQLLPQTHSIRAPRAQESQYCFVSILF